MQTEGRIISVQEQRFRLLTDQGQVYLLTLGPRAGLDGAGLARLHQQQTRVQVDFSGGPNLAGCVAHNVLASLAR